ncbi:MAG: hypothetical protein FWG84_10135 [Bacteroidales bacterium]|nr:hypothetical protein [Bacteroidales bacterium]
MKKVFYVTIAFLLSASSVWAQSTGGTDFWLTFGDNRHHPFTSVELQIRIVSGENPAKGEIYFTQLGPTATINFSIGAQEVYTYSLSPIEKPAVYNTSMGKSDRTIHITSDATITVYALNQASVSTDATNVMPVKALGNNYYQISHIPYSPSTYLDAYAVIGTENNTNVYHNGTLETTLDAGEVYYKTNATDMTGAHITTDKPVAFFAVSQGVRIPFEKDWPDCLMQQLAPVNTWGQTFFVPVSHLTKDRVRIVAAQNGTTVTQTNGVHISAPGGQTGPTYTINDGEYIELEALLANDGCYIQSDAPIGVCAYLTGSQYNGVGTSDPSQSWVPAIEQTVTEALIAPFVPNGSTQINSHYALLVTPTATKNNTMVSIGGAPPMVVSGGTWRDNLTAGMSFYTVPMTNPTASYHFTNDDGIIIWCYGVGNNESYYYLGFSAMRNLKASFNVNDVYYTELPPVFCEQDVDFHAEITELNPKPGSLKWYIDGVEEIAARDELEWSKTFAPGEYEIKMGVLFTDNDTTTLVTVFNIGAIISTSELPAGSGTTTGDGCYKVGDPVDVVATPNPGFVFLYWTEGGVEIPGATETYSFTASEDRTLVAHFAPEIPNTAEFYANDILHENLKDTIFCAKNVDFHAEIEGLSPDAGSLKWYIDGVEETAAQDMLDWSKEFETGVYEIKMEVVYANNTTETIIGTLKVEVFWIKIKNITH